METGMWRVGGTCGSPVGFGVSAAGESWLIPGWSFHTKPLSPLVPCWGTEAQRAGTPGSARAMKDFAWEGAESGQSLHLLGIGKEPRAVPAPGVLFLLCS